MTNCYMHIQQDSHILWRLLLILLRVDESSGFPMTKTSGNKRFFLC